MIRGTSAIALIVVSRVWPMIVVSFKAREEDHEKWKLQAAAGSISMGEWIRRRLNEASVGHPLTLPPDVEERLPKPRSTLGSTFGVKKKKEAVRTKAVCEHRLPPGTYCKRCEVLRK